MRISDWSSDVCSSDLPISPTEPEKPLQPVDAIEGEGSSLDAAESKQESAGPSASGGQGERKVATSAHQTNGTASDAALIRLPMLVEKLGEGESLHDKLCETGIIGGVVWSRILTRSE